MERDEGESSEPIEDAQVEPDQPEDEGEAEE